MKKFYYLYNGRSSLNLALANAGLKKKDEILYPEYSCDVIFQYHNKKKYNYKFYQIKDDFNLSFNLLKKKISNKTKVIIVINFFGIKQKLKNLYKFCKKKKILLFVDDCHTFYDLNKSSSNNCDVKFFSPSKIFNKIIVGGILQINNNSIQIENNLPVLKFNNTLTKIFKQKFKKTAFYEKLKFSKPRPKFENENFFKSKFLVNKYSLNKKDILKIKSLNFKIENKLRLKNFVYWNLICKKFMLKPILKINSIKHGCPLYFPAMCKSKIETIKLFDFGWKNKLEIVSWPTLHISQRKNKRLISHWKRMIYFPMDKKYFNNKRLYNFV